MLLCLKSILIITLVFTCNLINAQRACPIGWIINQEELTCYKISIQLISADWYSARQSCQALRADLLSISGQSEQDYLSRLINSNAYDNFWIGGKRRPTDQAWIWIDKNNYIDASSQITWATGRPDQFSGDCLQISKNKTFTNEDCSIPRPYICERQMGLPTTCDIDERWEPIDGSCVKIFQVDQSWEDARKVCMNEGADLIVVSSASLQYYLRDWFKLFKKPIWIGLSDKTSGNGGLAWVNTEQPNYTQQWLSGTPFFINDGSNKGNCTVINDQINGLWSIDLCTQTYNFACQKKPDECAPGWEPFKDKCYLFKIDRNLHTSWFDASSSCTNYNAQLVTIKSSPVQTFIQTQLKNSFSTQDFWLGMSDLKPIFNRYQWIDGEQVSGYTNWLEGEPKSVENRDNCGIVSVLRGLWYTTSNCFQKQPYICEADVNAPIIPNPSMITTFGGTSNSRSCVFPFIYKSKTYYKCINEDRDHEWCSTTFNFDQDQQWGYCPNVGVCPPGWSEYNLTCYRLFQDYSGQMWSWQDAQSKCEQAYGGNLARIHDSKIQTLLDSLMTNVASAWIGLVYKNQAWTWLNYFMLGGFKNWKFNYPSLTAPNYCGAMSGDDEYLGEWIDFPCDSKILSSFVCEKKAVVDGSFPTALPPVQTTFSAKCGPGWVERPFSSYCYSFKDEYVNIFEAKKACETSNGKLVSITSVDEQIFIQGNLNSLEINSFWLSANKESPSKGWTWDDGQPFIFVNWAQGQYMTSANQYCVILSKSYSYQWLTVDCNINSRFGYICKKEQLGATRPSTTSFPLQPGVNYGCLPGWYPYRNNHCYKHFDDKYAYKTFNEAKQSCKTQGADLVEINDDYENEFVVSLLGLRSSVDRVRSSLKQTLDCPAGWTKNDDSCYRLIKNATSWDNAQLSCSLQGGYLATIKTSNENSFLYTFAFTDIWIGLRRKANSIYFEWEDGQIANGLYSNWKPGNYPTNTNNTDRCVVASFSFTNTWIDVDCGTGSNNFVCERDLSYQDKCTQYNNPIDPDKYHGTCLHQDQCPFGFFTAENLCLDTNANNADIVCCLSATERTIEKLWIGMYDELVGLTQVSFKWLTGQQVEYASWAPQEPQTHLSDVNYKCVSFIKKDSVAQLGGNSYEAGQWEVTQCDFKLSYVCEKPIEKVPLTTPSPIYPGCPLGFTGYEKKCYTNQFAYKSWKDAEANCKQADSRANLISITDRFEQAWLTSLLNGVNERVWIGLSDLTSPGTFSWSSKEPVVFTHWDRNQPNGSKSICTALNPNGFWANYDCESKFISICMVPNSMYTTATTPTTPTPPKCAQGWSEGDAACYKLFDPPKADQKNWFEAEAHCKNLGGSLASWQTRVGFNAFSNGQQLSFKQNSNFWIGLNILDAAKGYQWSDGAPVTFTNWALGQPDNFNRVEDCAETRSTGQWYDANCYVAKGWVCKIDRGVDPTQAQPTFQSSNFTTSQCSLEPNDPRWLEYQEKCYFVSLGIGSEQLTWFNANNYCKQNGGFLLSIHTQREMQFVTWLASKKLDRWWIGLNQLSVTSGFVWADGTPVNYVNWNSGEPNNSNGGENCAEMFSSSWWNDANCGVLLGFVCEKLKDGSQSTSSDSYVQALSFGDGANICPAGYSTFGVSTSTGESCVFPFKYNGQIYYECITKDWTNPWCATTFDYDTDGKWGNCVSAKCYRFVEDLKLYTEARTACNRDSAFLASINNDFEQAYLTAQLRNRTYNNYYTGGWCPGGWTGTAFFWEDNTDFSYTRWAPGRPGSNVLFGSDKCVTLSGKSETAGLWQNLDCYVRRPFVCSKYAYDVKYASGCESWAAAVSDKVSLVCEANTKIVIIKADFGRDKYSLACDDKYHNGTCTVRDESVINTLRQQCGNKQTCDVVVDVNTFPDPCPNVVKMLRVWYQCVGDVRTIGGNANGASCVFPFKYNNIDHYQCTFEDSANFGNKKWCCTTPNCDTDFKWGNCPQAQAQAQNECKKEGYVSIDNGNNCYKVYSNALKTWSEAKAQCVSDNGDLLSIRDPYEQAYVSLVKTAGSTRSLWIGLKMNDSIAFYWSDNWPLAYTNWDRNWSGSVTNSNSTTNQQEKCAFLQAANANWNTSLCEDRMDFICKISKETPPPITTPAPGSCPNINWFAYGPNCYTIERTTRSYPDAKFDCAQKGGHLMSLNSRDEMEYLTNYVDTPTLKNQIWIGLEKNQISNAYEWNDGSYLIFTSFSSSFSSRQTCVYMLNNEWIDSDCLLFRRIYVCKRPKILDTTTSLSTSTTTTTTTTTTTSTTTTTTTTTSTSTSTSTSTTTSTTRTSTTTTTTTTSTTSTNSTSTTTTKTTTPKSTTQINLIKQTTPITKKSQSAGSVVGIVIGVLVVLGVFISISMYILKQNGYIRSYMPSKPTFSISTKYSRDDENVKIVDDFTNPNY